MALTVSAPAITLHQIEIHSLVCTATLAPKCNPHLAAYTSYPHSLIHGDA
jgi:hypothetical protein